MGSKRSGSTVLTNLLNTHSGVFVTHEADTAWILYQSRGGIPPRYRPHPLDSTKMMTTTLKDCRHILRSTLGDKPASDGIVEAFYRMQTHLLEKRQAGPETWEQLKRVYKKVGKRPKPRQLWEALREKPIPFHKENVAWIGDKKHAQHLDPSVRLFLRTHFPDARYIHTVRHPKGVVASMMDAAKNWNVKPKYFDGTAEQILEQWAIHEEWVLQAKEHESSPILTVRLEDLWADPFATTSRILSFLDLEMTAVIAESIPKLVYERDPNQKYASFALPDLPRANRIMEIYGY
jgi:hypothetical protein